MTMWIETVAPEDADGRLKKLYGEIAGPDGHVDNILVAHSLRPRTLEAHLHLYKAVLHARPNALSPRERELVGVVVSHFNGCGYCVDHHSAGLARHIGDEAVTRALIAQAVSEAPKDPITARERALVAYARKLTVTPSELTAEDLAPLRASGLDDGAILDLNQIVAYFAYANRTVLGLGVSTAGETLGLHPSEDEDGYRHG